VGGRPEPSLGVCGGIIDPWRGIIDSSVVVHSGKGLCVGENMKSCSPTQLGARCGFSPSDPADPALARLRLHADISRDDVGPRGGSSAVRCAVACCVEALPLAAAVQDALGRAPPRPVGQGAAPELASPLQALKNRYTVSS
jgi:hypothetical protein